MSNGDIGEPAAFTAGLTMPWKLLQCREAVDAGRIRPVHIKLFPTNRCNARCSFCSIQKWARDEELPIGEIADLLRHFHALGTRAVTLSGGGEPTMHAEFDTILDLCADLDIQVGMITNGLLWSDREKPLRADGRLVWARMSVVDTESGRYDVERLRRFSQNLPRVAVGCYAAITRGTAVRTIADLADLAEELPNVTHFKLGEDSSAGASEKMDELEALLHPGHGKMIFHRTGEMPAGRRDCLISLLRPVIAADGYVYPCCDMKLADGGYVEPRMFRMVHWSGFGPDTSHFDGSMCPGCLWDRYNTVLRNLVAPLEHGRFV